MQVELCARNLQVDQITYFNNRVASRDVSNYYLVLNGEFAYNKSTSDGYPFGAVKRLDLYEKGVLSTLYIVFAPKKEQQIDSDYLTVFFDTDRWHKGVAERAAEGARNHGLLNISAEDFFDIDLSVPKDIVEQKQIGAFIRQLDNLITRHQRQHFLHSTPDISLSVRLIHPFYTFSWEQRKLGDIADIVGGGTPSTGNQSYWDGDIDWYAPAEIADQIYANSSQKKITGLGYENSSAKMLPPGTVLFTSRAGIGKTAILTRKGCTNQGFQSIVPHRGELDSYFIFSRTEELKRYGELVGAGSTFVEVSGKQMAVMELMMPPTMREQQTIGGFFQQLDHLITLHQRKFEKLTNVKKSMLEKMFPQNGSSYPEIRFKGFTDPWEQRKFEEIAVRSSVICSDDTLPRVEYEDIVSGTGRLNKDIYAKQSSKSGIVFHQGDVLYGKLRPYLQNWLLPTFDGLAVGDFWVLQPQNADSSFLYRLIQSRQFDEVANQSTGTKMPRADWKLVSKTVFSIPSNISEQAAIGTYFTALDSLITLHQRKCVFLFGFFQAFISMIFTASTFSWEQRKLASLCEKFTDGDWIESKDQSDFGVRLVQTGNVGVAEYLDKPNNKKWISEDTFDRLHCEEVLPGDILISRLPEPAGRACIVPLLGTKMITAVDCTIVRTAPDMSNKFLVQYLSSQAYFDDVNTCLAGGTRQRISRGNLANFNVPIPVKKSEQDAIGMFFGYLDNLITLHQRQTIVYAVIRSIRKVILAERQYFAPPMVRKSP